MYRAIKIFLITVCLTFSGLTFSGVIISSEAQAQDDIHVLIDALGVGDFPEREAAIKALVASKDQHVSQILQQLSDGLLYVNSDGGPVLLQGGTDDEPTYSDPITGEPAADVDPDLMTKVKINNALRGVISAATSQLTLMSPDRSARLAAAQGLLKDADPANLDLLNSALAAEKDAEIKNTMEAARAVLLLKTDASVEDKKAAIDTIAARGNRDALTILTTTLETAPEDLKPAIQADISSINRSLALWDIVQNIWYGLSLGSVLLLAAIGLAITFGVMGVINMAHGEMVMIGAYTTYVVQEYITSAFPELADYSLAFAVPAAFVFTGFVGLLIERAVIRYLYGRPLETLLATWGVSLILQQAVRSIFGPTNREVRNPTWMSGVFDLGGLSITWNRLWIIVFSMVVFVALLLLLKRSAFGLQMRAVTQNRRMASSMGIRTGWVDAFTFALGSGIAGIAGVALSQIDNVSPNLGQSYIIDSFMVVVFGGVGNLWGTLVGALSLGVVNKFLEPFAGAVLGKILVLVLIILFIQKRPRGLFALKGRAVEA
ncbi:urea ABC transporter permease subunit UrtB [Rhizobium leguminosarum]|uniref:Urea ABC transporter permease subunit UrtB n=1 Tax=Rhizobium leguminosarum TaxID=384 RepID=A0A444IP25_RHILE|nr:urea ABC transporter permease subunit UrtB [Rhizobium leguminosarum]ASS56060.1 branched-chain amino acid ABC transporter permease [Rhizobium leguminosarum bv. viciae]AVC51154.1 urea ABC transporter, permease protein UrtB [Rhizobium leguminosarum bv. viciae]MBB4331275.1 urea transport system permease protein [Rhizobium leguminosarum]MBB4338716.1 urea transport system permease protein [Rhizobium leguminosarum]MBB4356615.1 urea transport system permease protein [Rhizobium leguminosarum]